MLKRYVVLLRALSGLVLLLFAWGIAFTLEPSTAYQWLTGGLVALAFGTLVWSTFPYSTARRAFADRKRALASYRVDIALKKVCQAQTDGTRLPLYGVFELNRRQLDEYQEMTKRQQNLAFRLTWIAAATAFAVLLAGVILSLTREGPDRYLVAGLTGLGSVLSTFLGKTFFDRHRDAMAQLNYYYAEPSMTGRILAAERIASNMGEGARAEYAKKLVETVLTWEPPMPPGHKKPGNTDSAPGLP